MRVRIVGVLLVSAVALLALSTQAIAAEVGDVISMRYAGSFTGSRDATGKFDGVTAFTTGGGGLIKFQNQTDGEYFYAFCIELVEVASTSYRPYTVADPADAPVDNDTYGQMGADGAAAMDALFGTTYFKGWDPVYWTDVEAFGFQLAIWEIVYEYAAGFGVGDTLDLFSGDFLYDTPVALSNLESSLAYAENALDAMGTDTVSTFALTNTGFQDYILSFSVGQEDIPVVPLPPAALGGLFLLGGLAAARRRRKIRAE